MKNWTLNQYTINCWWNICRSYCNNIPFTLKKLKNWNIFIKNLRLILKNWEFHLHAYMQGDRIFCKIQNVRYKPCLRPQGKLKQLSNPPPPHPEKGKLSVSTHNNMQACIYDKFWYIFSGSTHGVQNTL